MTKSSSCPLSIYSKGQTQTCSHTQWTVLDHMIFYIPNHYQTRSNNTCVTSLTDIEPHFQGGQLSKEGWNHPRSIIKIINTAVYTTFTLKLKSSSCPFSIMGITYKLNFQNGLNYLLPSSDWCPPWQTLQRNIAEKVMLSCET